MRYYSKVCNALASLVMSVRTPNGSDARSKVWELVVAIHTGQSPSPLPEHAKQWTCRILEVL